MFPGVKRIQIPIDDNLSSNIASYFDLCADQIELTKVWINFLNIWHAWCAGLYFKLSSGLKVNTSGINWKEMIHSHTSPYATLETGRQCVNTLCGRSQSLCNNMHCLPHETLQNEVNFGDCWKVIAWFFTLVDPLATH